MGHPSDPERRRAGGAVAVTPSDEAGRRPRVAAERVGTAGTVGAWTGGVVPASRMAAVGRRTGRDEAVPAEPDRGAAENTGVIGAKGRRGEVCVAGASENDTAAAGRCEVTGAWVLEWENVTRPAVPAGAGNALSVSEAWEENWAGGAGPVGLGEVAVPGA